MSTSCCFLRQQRREKRQFERVLRYWFGSSREEINARYTDLWFTPVGPIQREIDAEAAIRFESLLGRAERGRLCTKWGRRPRGLLALIIVTDQLSRHIYRHKVTAGECTEASARQAIQRAGKIATRALNLLVKRGWETSLSIPERVFALLPWRHNPSKKRLRACLAAGSNMLISIKETESRLVERFLAHTERVKRETASRPVADGSILEREGFEMSQTEAKKFQRHALVKHLDSFLREQLTPGTPAVAVSVSGGVDSMALAQAVASLSTRHGGYKTVAVHINYGNRPETDEEESFVDGWCCARGITCERLKMPLKRDEASDRGAYESETRNLRYGAYREALARHSAPCILLGHHQANDDPNLNPEACLE